MQLPINYCTYIFFLQALSALLLVYNLKRGLRTSGLQFLFWLFLAICGAVQFRTEIRNAQEATPKPFFPYISYLAYYSLVLLMVFLNCFADQAPLHSNYGKTEVMYFSISICVAATYKFIFRGRLQKKGAVFFLGFCFLGLIHWHGPVFEDRWKILICGT